MLNEPEFLTRRRFFVALAASVLAVGLPLPIGMSTKTALASESLKFNTWYESGTFAWIKWECKGVRFTGPFTPPTISTEPLNA